MKISLIQVVWQVIRGVNKQIVEINYTNDDYIEKAILIINPEKSGLPQETINQKADDYMQNLFPEKKKRLRSKARLLIAGGILSLALIAVVCLLFWL